MKWKIVYTEINQNKNYTQAKKKEKVHMRLKDIITVTTEIQKV